MNALGVRLDSLARDYFTVPGLPGDFAHPAGEPALAAPDSVSWRVFKNPVTLFIGGIAAVLLELAEPRVRAGVWDHSSFRRDPVTRLKRTGLAAMITVYGARSLALPMIEGVGRAHARVTGETTDGRYYRADDPALLDWVQATASFGFLNAYHLFAEPLPPADRDRFYAEAAPAARLCGAVGAPVSEAELEAQFEAMAPNLERSAVVFEFLDIMGQAPALPAAAAPLQRLLIRAAVEVLPPWVRTQLGLERRGLSPAGRMVVRALARIADRIAIRGAPPAQACLRMGLPADHLYR